VIVTEFIPGLALSERYFREVVEPLLEQNAPGLRYAAGLIGAGSDVTGFDTARSMDHDWGPRLFVWLDEADFDTHGEVLTHALGRELPGTFLGFPTRVGRHDDGTAHMGGEPGGEHLVTFTTVRRWFGGDPGNPDARTWPRLPPDWLDLALAGTAPPLDPATWLTLPEQWLLENTAGRIYRDDQGTLTRVRKALAWYPDDVWRYRMAAQWRRIDQLEPFTGRCGEVGDDLGSHLVAMTLVRDVMKLAFLMERRYAPYPKWLGTAFSRLDLATALMPSLDRARYATDWREREAGVLGAVEVLAHRHNAMGLTEPVDPAPTTFFGRPFRVMFAGRFGEALLSTVTDPAVQALPLHLGGLDQYIDSTDAFNRGDLHRAIREWIVTEGDLP